LGVAEALEQLARLGTADLGFARVDHHRDLRRGLPEVIFGERKSPEQVRSLVEHLAARRAIVLVTRLDPAVGRDLAARFATGSHNPVARTFYLPRPGRRRRGRAGLLIVSAGTADLPVAEECAVTAEAIGLAPERLYDVGVAGIHRLFEQGDRLRRARVVAVVAGMEGALPSVVAGLVDVPVIGVPTSVGYGAALSGFTALFGMLTSCAGGMTVVNIDNGFGAACAARLILSPRGR
jgi:NCAIR mutase (PurE)-related protein